MITIKEIVQQALTTGYLSATAKHQIHKLLQTNYDSEDLDALIILQRSIVAGAVNQESLRKKNYSDIASKDKDASPNIKLAYKIAAEMAFAAAIALTMPHNPQDQPSIGT
ncbi:hypothetical protein PN497_04845 [Sphaerospermopsis kisseleviana CS-549]|jgi:hypothetical protein|uniref:Uncharacterized protein n=2 Tax=Sphaerospermopsis TaxID=752201 RepID=A0ABR9VDJ4_9CYAN|nr:MULTISPECIES: hypothetical protein [Sphaerospermopsis]BAZ79999.1 hypothetical protein NIES73_12470 [Sphaerospermopsis kisseleviana NIES-73]MBD2134713.1 hypothetical protein [Sphaerospermopsis sp. FACHB-1094]MBD2147750.1 hypothetical protein [Sphaerospermopsis sp. FACHB-1194]MBE9236549.1 hypothetical protein [Sphaerospermopsis aphanizomenoides LEGE 00250]MDB9440691.1 hypothetical protein [Sphaerospermopsis kisseleviana CS-549]